MRQHGLALFVRPHNAQRPVTTTDAKARRPLHHPLSSGPGEGGRADSTRGSNTAERRGQTMFDKAAYILARITVRHPMARATMLY